MPAQGWWHGPGRCSSDCAVPCTGAVDCLCQTPAPRGVLIGDSWGTCGRSVVLPGYTRSPCQFLYFQAVFLELRAVFLELWAVFLYLRAVFLELRAGPGPAMRGCV